jgi:hypothetical protein
VLSIKETIISVLVSSNADGGEVVVINPNAGRLINVDKVLTLGCPVELDVADDDIVGLADLEATVGDTSSGANTENRSVADDLDDTTASKGTLDLDDTTLLSGGGQTSAVADSGTSTAATTGCASGETDELIDSSGPLLHGSGGDGTGSRHDGSNLEETHVDDCW